MYRGVSRREIFHTVIQKQHFTDTARIHRWGQMDLPKRHFAPRSFLSEGEVYTFRTHQFTANGKKVPTELFTRLSQAKD